MWGCEVMEERKGCWRGGGGGGGFLAHLLRLAAAGPQRLESVRVDIAQQLVVARRHVVGAASIPPSASRSACQASQSRSAADVDRTPAPADSTASIASKIAFPSSMPACPCITCAALSFAHARRALASKAASKSAASPSLISRRRDSR